MRQFNPRKTVLVCLDIDDTLINFKTGEFNGSVHLWRSAFRRIKAESQEKGFECVFQIITSKYRVDVFVDKVAHALREFLIEYDMDDSSGTLSKDGYLILTHTKNTRTPFNVSRKSGHIVVEPVSESRFPAIHLCGIGDKRAISKAYVMHYLSLKLGNKEDGPIPCEQIFMLDDNEIIQHRDGGLPIYTCVCAKELQQFADYSSAVREELAHKIVSRFEATIKNRLLNLVEPSCEERSTSTDSTDSTDTADEKIHISRTDLNGFRIQRKNKQILDKLNFSTHLSFYQEKAKRKLDLANKYPNNTNVKDIMFSAQRLHQRLNEAERKFMLGGDTEASTNDFVQECRSALLEADKHLLKHFLFTQSGFSLFTSKKSYAHARNELMMKLEELEKTDSSLVLG